MMIRAGVYGSGTRCASTPPIEGTQHVRGSYLLQSLSHQLRPALTTLLTERAGKG